jgi:GT2 family glycosyltransferase
MHVSIIILNYNGSRFLRDLFESLSNQTFGDFEVIFVDNKSTDNSLQLLNDFLSNERMKNLRIKIVKNSTNLGYCQGNNAGIRHAEGKYIVFLNNDTYVSRSWLEELVRVMDNHLSIGACQSRLIDIQTSKVQMDGRLLDVYGWSRRLILDRSDLPISIIPFYVSGASIIVKTSALLRIGGFDPELFAGDHDLCWRLRLLGYDMAVALHSICYHYGGVATKMLVSSVKSVYNHDKEMQRVLLKNYSIGNVFKRIPLSVIIMLVEATYFSFEYKNPLYLGSFLQALISNLRKLRDTFIARYQVQNDRKMSDREIEKKMLHYSVLLRKGVLR